MSVAKAKSRDGSPSGNWTATVRDALGRKRSKTFPRKSDAERWEREQLARRDRGQEIDIDTARRMTVQQYGEQWRVIQPHRPLTAKKVEGCMRLHVYPHLGHRKLAAVRPSEVKAWYARLPLAESSKRIVYGWLAALFASAVHDRLIAESPCTLAVGTTKHPPIEALTIVQVNALVDATFERHQVLFETIAGTGLRGGEARGLTVDRVDFIRRQVKVDRQLATLTGRQVEFGPPKSDAGYRTVPITERLAQRLSQHVQQYGTGQDGLLFTTSTGAPISRAVLSQVWRTAVRRSAEPIPDWATVHDLRHHYASLLIASGCNVKQVQRVMGHESAGMTLDVYGHLFPNDDDAIRSALSAHHEPVVERPSLVVVGR